MKQLLLNFIFVAVDLLTNMGSQTSALLSFIDFIRSNSKVKFSEFAGGKIKRTIYISKFLTKRLYSTELRVV